MSDISVEIYIQKLREFLKKDPSAKVFFSGSEDESVFIEEVKKISIDNVKNGRPPELNEKQYNNVRNSIINKRMESVEDLDIEDRFIIDKRNYFKFNYGESNDKK
jgi:hypothetical protein